MAIAITEGVKVSVETIYQPKYSNPAGNLFMFAYRIEITNESIYPVQLLRRLWLIFDSDNNWREVEGEGVVGEQPILNPGESHIYVSGCNLKTDIGSMQGEYLMKRLSDNTIFDVDIPKFALIAPYRLN